MWNIRRSGRMVTPAILAKVVDGVGAAAAAIVAEGVRPMLHPHVGSAIEVENEIDTVLQGVPDSILGFGPDTGHLTWAGVNPVKIMSRYSDAHRSECISRMFTPIK